MHGTTTVAHDADRIRQTMAAYVGLQPHMDVVTHRATRAGDVAMTRAPWLVRGVGPDGRPIEFRRTRALHHQTRV